MALYSQRFVSGSFSVGTSDTFRPPDNAIWVVRCIDVYTVADDIFGQDFHIVDEEGGNTWFFGSHGPESEDLRQYYSWRGRQVFATFGFYIQVGGASTDFRISGYQLGVSP